MEAALNKSALEKKTTPVATEDKMTSPKEKKPVKKHESTPISKALSAIFQKSKVSKAKIPKVVKVAEPVEVAPVIVAAAAVKEPVLAVAAAVTTAKPMITKPLQQSEVKELVTEQTVSTAGLQNVMSAVLEPSKISKLHTLDEQTSAFTEATGSDMLQDQKEPLGFIGKYSNKVQKQT